VNGQELARLLGVAATVDPRFPALEPATLKVWFKFLQDIPFEVAAEVMGEHYGRTEETITPSVLVAGWKRWRADAVDRRTLERPRPEFDPERVHRGVDQVLAALAAAKGLPADVAEGETSWRRLVLAVPCTWEACRAGAGQLCTGPGGRPLTRRLAHDCREVAARARASHA
jgi:hypothetical protein